MCAIIELQDVSKEFPMKSTLRERVTKETKSVSAVHHVNLSIQTNEILSLVGESGCGKSTLANVIIQLLDDYTGKIFFKGECINEKSKKWLQEEFKPRVQMAFQDPYSCLNPKKKVRGTLSEVLKVHKICAEEDREAYMIDILNKCGLSEEVMGKYPRELSGGQCQRVGIARALLTSPDILIADEPISALDVSVQAQIINMLLDLREEMNLTILFISHDLEIVKYISDRIAVMYLGEIVELADTEELFRNPVHPYTQLLLSSAPGSGKTEEEASDLDTTSLPNAIDLPKGCRFQTRCPYASSRCREEAPKTQEVAPGHQVACHLVDEKST